MEGLAVRGLDRRRGKLFSYASPESLVPQQHPLRAIRPLVNAALDRLSADFAAVYSDNGRPSIPPEKLLRALLLQKIFSVRSERQLMDTDGAHVHQPFNHAEHRRWLGRFGHLAQPGQPILATWFPPLGEGVEMPAVFGG